MEAMRCAPAVGRRVDEDRKNAGMCYFSVYGGADTNVFNTFLCSM